METELRPIQTIRPYPRNPRHNSPAVDAVAASIREFGFRQPIVVDEAGVIIVGHTRWKAAKKLGLKRVPVHVARDLTPAQAKAYRIADNRSADLATWNKQLLAEEVTALINTEIDLTALQLDERHIQEILQKSGFREGAGYAKTAVTDWRGADEFFDCPDDIRERIDNASRLIVQFSGGKDSTAVLLWAVRNFPNKTVEAVFVDTGVEFPGMGAHVANVADALGAKLQIVKPRKEWWSHWRTQGRWPSILYRPCMTEFIHKPFARAVKAAGKSSKLAVLTGSRAEEGLRGSKKTSTSELSSLGSAAKHVFHYAPMFNVRKGVIEAAVANAKVPLWSGYARGFVRTACWCCPGQCGLQAATLQEHYPGLANDIRLWEKTLGRLQPEARRGKGLGFDDLVAIGESKRPGKGAAKRQ